MRITFSYSRAPLNPYLPVDGQGMRVYGFWGVNLAVNLSFKVAVETYELWGFMVDEKYELVVNLISSAKATMRSKNPELFLLQLQL